MCQFTVVPPWDDPETARALSEPGSHLVLCGSIPELGSWRPDAGGFGRWWSEEATVERRRERVEKRRKRTQQRECML